MRSRFSASLLMGLRRRSLVLGPWSFVIRAEKKA
jgi:hypothetical protein